MSSSESDNEDLKKHIMNEEDDKEEEPPKEEVREKQQQPQVQRSDDNEVNINLSNIQSKPDLQSNANYNNISKQWDNFDPNTILKSQLTGSSMITNQNSHFSQNMSNTSQSIVLPNRPTSERITGFGSSLNNDNTNTMQTFSDGRRQGQYNSYNNNRGNYREGGRDDGGNYNDRPRGNYNNFQSGRNDNFRGGSGRYQGPFNRDRQNFNNNRNFDNRGGGGGYRGYRNYDNNNNNNFRNQEHTQIIFPNKPDNNATEENLDLNPFYNWNKEWILEVRNVFEDLPVWEIIKILKILSLNCAKTIFELMNEITRMSIIYKNQNEHTKQGNTQINYTESNDIDEIVYRGDLNSYHESVMKYYKVLKETDTFDSKIINNNTNFWYTNTKESRRKLLKDNNGTYNYLPLLVWDNYAVNRENYYALNENEINYHSLWYKTIACRKQTCQDTLCPNSHGLEKDFRIIYDYKNEKICKLMNWMSSKDFKALHIQSYLDFFPIPTKFSLNDFKIHECPLFHSSASSCPIDYHVCLKYHACEESRRPPFLFRYDSTPCENVWDDNSKYSNNGCANGIFCPKLHTLGEDHYHANNFGQVVDCTRSRDAKNRCIFYKTCYGIHSNSKGKKSKTESKRNKATEKNQKEIIKLEEKYEKAKRIADLLRCRSCNKLPSNGYYIWLTKCKHLTCAKCFSEKMIMKKKSECIICGEKYQNWAEEAIKIAFKNNSEDDKNDESDEGESKEEEEQEEQEEDEDDNDENEEQEEDEDEEKD